jgi:hypothetical protein
LENHSRLCLEDEIGKSYDSDAHIDCKLLPQLINEEDTHFILYRSAEFLPVIQLNIAALGVLNPTLWQSWSAEPSPNNR